MKIQYSEFLYRQTFVFPSASLHININLCLEPLVALFEYFADVLQREKNEKTIARMLKMGNSSIESF